MAQPIASRKQDAEQAWYLQLDLDGNPATGLQAEGDPQMFTGLGADALVILELDESGALMPLGGVRFIAGSAAEGQPRTSVGMVPLDVQLSDDRTTIDIDIPVLLLIEAAANLPGSQVFSPETMHWRIGRELLDCRRSQGRLPGDRRDVPDDTIGGRRGCWAGRGGAAGAAYGRTRCRAGRFVHCYG